VPGNGSTTHPAPGRSENEGHANRRTELAGFLRARRARLSPRQAGPQVRHAHETPLQVKGSIRERACGAHMTPPRC
jgi:hypothetical protein